MAGRVRVRGGVQWGEEGAPMGHNVSASSLGGGRRGVKDSHIPGESPAPWVSPRVILH